MHPKSPKIEVSWGYLGGPEVVDKMVTFFNVPSHANPHGSEFETNFDEFPQFETNSNEIRMLSSDLGACLSIRNFKRDPGGPWGDLGGSWGGLDGFWWDLGGVGLFGLCFEGLVFLACRVWGLGFVFFRV